MRTIHAELIESVEWWVLIATVVSTPLVFSRWTFDVFNLTELTALWIGVIVAVVLELVRLPSGGRLTVPRIWPYAVAYLAVLGLTTLTSRAPVVSLFGNYGRLGGLLTAVPAVLLAWLLFASMTRRDGRRQQLLVAVAASSLAGAAYLLSQELNIETQEWLQFGGVEPTHPPGFLGNSNFSGAHVAMGIGPMVWLAARSQRHWRILWIGAVLVALAGVGVSQSRGAMLATALALGLAASQFRPGLRRLLIVGAGAVLVLGSVTLATSNRGISDLIDNNTGDQRVDLWDVALRGSQDHLILGGGPDLYLLTFRDNAGSDLEGVVADEPHNVLLDQLDGSGLLGAAAWLALVAAVIVMARAGPTRRVGPWALMGATYLGQSLVSIEAVPLQLWAWVAVAGVAASARPGVPTGAGRPVAAVTLLAGAAVAVVAVVLAVAPFRADMAYRRGIIASNAGDTATAVAQFEQAAARHRWEPRYPARLGLELWATVDLRDPAAAASTRQALLDALELFPDDPSANEWLNGVESQIGAPNG